MLISALLLVGCGQPPAETKDTGTQDATGQTDGTTEGTETATPTPTSTTPLRVFASDSLNAALPTLASRYRATHDGRELSVTFGKSPDLAQRIIDNKQADLFLADNEDVVRQLNEAGLVASATVFLGGQIVVITNAERPVLLSVIEDLKNAEVTAIGVPASDLPSGKLIYAALQENALLNPLQPKLKTYDSLNAVIRAVGKGEVPVGFAFAHAVRGKRDVKNTLTVTAQVTPEYIGVAIAGSDNVADAESFIVILQDQESQAAFQQSAFTILPARTMY